MKMTRQFSDSSLGCAAPHKYSDVWL